MTFQGFQYKDFETFTIDGLDERMEAIQTRIQPKFQEVGSELAAFLSAHLGNEVFLHIARHARRTVNPPKDTWLAIADNKRGYKKHPHFQVGLFDDHVFIWLAFIYELPSKKEIGQMLINKFSEIKSLPSDFVVSLDHMQKDSPSLDELKLEHLERFRDVKKGEFLVGRHLAFDDDRVKDGDIFTNIAKDTFQTLIPLYQQSLQAR